jgi:hypothetical protein
MRVLQHIFYWVASPAWLVFIICSTISIHLQVWTASIALIFHLNVRWLAEEGEGTVFESTVKGDCAIMMDSHHKFPASRLKTDQFFLHWLALPENQDLVRCYDFRRSVL